MSNQLMFSITVKILISQERFITILGEDTYSLPRQITHGKHTPFSLFKKNIFLFNDKIGNWGRRLQPAPPPQTH